MRLKASIFGVTAILFFVANAHAAEAIKYGSVEEIPRQLRQHFGSGSYRESYVSQIVSQLRQIAPDKATLTKQDIEKMQTRDEKRRRHEQVTQTLVYDDDFDGRVTRDEVVDSMHNSYRSYGGAEYLRDRDSQVTRQADRVMKLDTNNDGFVTLAEMAVLTPRETSYRGERSFDDLLLLDPNGDGKLTAAELEGLARKAYATIDTNDDGIITAEEAKVLQEINRKDGASSQRRAELQSISADCTLPKVPSGAKLVVIGAYEGRAVSSVSVAGQVEETDVIPLDISKGADKLYILASTFKPVIWKITGDLTRVSHLVIGGPSIPEGTSNNDMGEGKVNAGETGIPREKVTFFHARNCGLNKLWKEPASTEILSRLVGVGPASQAAAYSVGNVKIDNSSAGINEKYDLHPVPDGFDAVAWQEYLRSMPGGLFDLQSKAVVSDAPAVDYQVLPNWAGMAKLIHEGALVPTKSSSSALLIGKPGSQITIQGIENIRGGGGETQVTVIERPSAYRVVKNIPFYPSGLYGGFSTNFVIAKGVTPPKGDPGHSKVTCEEASACPERN
ncbi:MAG: hypothetical protein EPN97_00685 [Alphaproteobacteria bacterium]|nr:MAG: hypothetical protein EPN97_00685 [Alphaproteobacteria bacterium]